MFSSHRKLLQHAELVKFYLFQKPVYLVAGPRNIQMLFARSSRVGTETIFLQIVFPSLYGMSEEDVQRFANDKSGRDRVPTSGSKHPATDGAFGYSCSKWVNEQLLEHTNAQYGLPVCIYRPSTIIREGLDARASSAQLDWTNALLHYIRKLSAAPKLKNNGGALNFTHIESCCESVLYHLTANSDVLD